MKLLSTLSLKFPLLAIMLFSRGILVAQPNDCKVFLNESGNIVHIKPTISAIRSQEVNPYSFRASKGIFLNCKFYVDSSHYRSATITSFRYSFVRNGSIFAAGISQTPFWDSSLRATINLIRKGDSLFISDIKAEVVEGNTSIELSKNRNVIVDSLSVVFTSSIIMPSKEELAFNEDLNNVETFARLIDIYGSHINIGRSINVLGFKHNRRTFSRRYKFVNSNFVDYDFTFIKNKNGAISNVYDNLKKKNYSVSQWEIMMSKTRKDTLHK